MSRLSSRAALVPIMLYGVPVVMTPVLMLGSGISLLKAWAPVFMRLGGITLSTPPEENTQRFSPKLGPLVMPDVGSNTIPCCNGTVAPSVVQTLTPGTVAPKYELKFPFFRSSVGMRSVKPSAWCCQLPSQFPKKKSLSFLIGPPTATPSLLRIPVLLPWLYQFLAFKASSVWNP